MKYYLLLLLLPILGCAQSGTSEFESIVRKRAAFDFNCSATELSIVAKEENRYLVKRDGKEAVYKVKCSLGPCFAEKTR